MNADQQALLRTVLKYPDADLPRLVYADWLEEHGNPDRASFIRLQCELETLDPYSPKRTLFESEEAKHIKRFAARWIRADKLTDWIDPQALAHAHKPARFRRGFVERIEFGSPSPCLAQLARVSQHTPLTGLSLRDAYSIAFDEEQWFTDTYFNVYHASVGLPLSTRHAAGGTEFPTPHEFQRLVESERLSGIQSFALGGLHTDRRHLELLSSSPLAARLRELDLSGNICLSGDAWGALRGSAFPKLESLRMDDCQQVAGLESLFGGEPFPSLRRLSLEAPSRLTPLGPQGVRTLCESQALPQLQELNLRGQRGGAEGLRTLTAWSGLKRMTRLDLSYFYGEDDWDEFNRGWGEFARSPNWGDLRELIVEGDCLERLEAILESPNCRTLRSLTFTNPFERSTVDVTALTLPGTVPPTGWVTDSQQDDAAELLARCPNLADGLLLRMPDAGLSRESRKRLRDRFGDGLELVPGDHCRPGDWMSGRTALTK